MMQAMMNVIEPLLLFAILCILSACFRAWGSAFVYAAQMIYQAALDTELVTGREKMDWVVAQVKAYLPVIMRMIITDSRVRQSCQSLYDSLKNFGVNYLEQQINQLQEVPKNEE